MAKKKKTNKKPARKPKTAAKAKAKRSNAATPSARATRRSSAARRPRAMASGAADDSIRKGDTVVTVEPLVSPRPKPSVPIPVGSRGEVTEVNDVGTGIGYVVKFIINGAAREAPAFPGQIRKV